MDATLRLRDVFRQVIVIAHTEDTSDLEAFFRDRGLPTVRQARVGVPEDRGLPSITRCLLNHRQAWEAIAQGDGYTLVCEADFVPTLNCLDEPVFWPLEDPLAYGYLYQCSPRLIAVEGPHLRVHCAGLVAYAVGPAVASVLLDFYEHERTTFDLSTYTPFDTHLQWYCMGRGASAYMSRRQLGEHGGVTSSEHSRAGAARGGRHRADVLAGPLAFPPPYARGERGRYAAERLFGRMVGLARILTGRWTIDTDRHTWTRRKRLDAHLRMGARFLRAR